MDVGVVGHGVGHQCGGSLGRHGSMTSVGKLVVVWHHGRESQFVSVHVNGVRGW